MTEKERIRIMSTWMATNSVSPEDAATWLAEHAAGLNRYLKYVARSNGKEPQWMDIIMTIKSIEVLVTEVRK